MKGLSVTFNGLTIDRRIAIAVPLILSLALTSVTPVFANPIPVQTSTPVVPLNESEPDTSEIEAKATPRGNERWLPNLSDSDRFPICHPYPTSIRPIPFDRTVPAHSPTDGPRLRC